MQLEAESSGLAESSAARYRSRMTDSSNTYDVIVAGMGAMGSLTTYELARRGHRVLGIDRFAPPHAMGSSHGHSRIIREAYFEDPRYVPLVQQAYRLWAELETASGRTLFQQTGGLMLGPPNGTLVRGARLSAELHRLPHDILSADAVHQRFPAFHPSDEMIGVWEPRAGILSPEVCIGAALSVAASHGAALHPSETVLGFDEIPGGVEVTTTHGRYRAKSLVLSVGAWTRELLADLQLPLVVQRNVMFWFEPLRRPEQFTAEAFPIFISEYGPNQSWYGFPDVGDGLKIAFHHYGAAVDPNTIDRTVGPHEVDVVRDVMARYMPDANGPVTASAACMYTNTPDEHFLIGRHPAHDRVIVASPCSGHGFKFASAIGAVLANLATEKEPGFDISSFALERFSA